MDGLEQQPSKYSGFQGATQKFIRFCPSRAWLSPYLVAAAARLPEATSHFPSALPMIPVENPRFTNSRFPLGWPANLVHSPESVRSEPHRVLRISRHEKDPVRIILAAQIQLRRWRRQESLAEQAVSQAASQAKTRQRIKQIIAARESLLMAAVTRIGIPDRILARRFYGRLA